MPKHTPTATETLLRAEAAALGMVRAGINPEAVPGLVAVLEAFLRTDDPYSYCEICAKVPNEEGGHAPDCCYAAGQEALEAVRSTRGA